MILKSLIAGMLAILAMKAEDKVPEKLEAKAHQEMMIAEAQAAIVEDRPKYVSAREWLSLHNTVIENETNGSLRIHENQCRVKVGECDRGRARGLYQEHRNKRNDADLILVLATGCGALSALVLALAYFWWQAERELTAANTKLAYRARNPFDVAASQLPAHDDKTEIINAPPLRVLPGGKF